MGSKKKTAPRSHRTASSHKPSGLIAQGENAQRSARKKYALDNRSHRTALRFTCAATTAPVYGSGPTAKHD